MQELARMLAQTCAAALPDSFVDSLSACRKPTRSAAVFRTPISAAFACGTKTGFLVSGVFFFFASAPFRCSWPTLLAS